MIKQNIIINFCAESCITIVHNDMHVRILAVLTVDYHIGLGLGSVSAFMFYYLTKAILFTHC